MVCAPNVGHLMLLVALEGGIRINYRIYPIN